MTVEFSSFDTERGFDYVFFDGDDSVFDRTSGSDPPETYTSTASSVEIGFHSDRSSTADGFAATAACPAAGPLAHAGEDCWTRCSQQQGPCDWCGSGNLCCRHGWDDHSNGCDGTLGIPGSGHVCVAPATAATSAR